MNQWMAVFALPNADAIRERDEEEFYLPFGMVSVMEEILSICDEGRSNSSIDDQLRYRISISIVVLVLRPGKRKK